MASRVPTADATSSTAMSEVSLRRRSTSSTLAFGELLADVDTVGDADEFGVFELDAGALVAVVEQDVDAGGVEGSGDVFAGREQVGLRRRW